MLPLSRRSRYSTAASARAQDRRAALVLMLTLSAAAALWLFMPGAQASELHEPEAGAAQAAPKVSLKPNLKAEAEASRPVSTAASAASAAPRAAATTAPASGDLETLRQRLNDRVAEVRRKQTETPSMNLVVRSPAAHRAAPRRVSHEQAGEHKVDHPGEHQAGHWSYAGEGGPEAWGRMKPEFSMCSIGRRQSPIDIRDGIRVDLDPIVFDYRATGFNVVDNGHTVQVNVGSGNAITVGTRRFELVQFHFHRPSEERINGRQFEMVAHLVHKDLDGRLAVVAVLMDQGRQHPLVQQVWNNLPLEKNVSQPALAAMDLGQLLPEDRRYYTYMGSLTTPPCTEGVLWIVMKQPATLSPEQLAVFAKLYPMNARPIQQVSDRLIKESN